MVLQLEQSFVRRGWMMRGQGDIQLRRDIAEWHIVRHPSSGCGRFTVSKEREWGEELLFWQALHGGCRNFRLSYESKLRVSVHATGHNIREYDVGSSAHRSHGDRNRRVEDHDHRDQVGY